MQPQPDPTLQLNYWLTVVAPFGLGKREDEREGLVHRTAARRTQSQLVHGRIRMSGQFLMWHDTNWIIES